MERKIFNELVQSLKEAKLISRASADRRDKRSVGHTDQTLDWLKRDPIHCGQLLTAALETSDVEDFMAALRLVTEARGGVTKIAAETGLNREMLYCTLSKKGNPKLSSLLPILHAAGLRLTVRAA